MPRAHPPGIVAKSRRRRPKTRRTPSVAQRSEPWTALYPASLGKSAAARATSASPSSTWPRGRPHRVLDHRQDRCVLSILGPAYLSCRPQEARLPPPPPPSRQPTANPSPSTHASATSTRSRTSCISTTHARADSEKQIPRYYYQSALEATREPEGPNLVRLVPTR